MENLLCSPLFIRAPPSQHTDLLCDQDQKKPAFFATSPTSVDLPNGLHLLLFPHLRPHQPTTHLMGFSVICLVSNGRRWAANSPSVTNKNLKLTPTTSMVVYRDTRPFRFIVACRSLCQTQNGVSEILFTSSRADIREALLWFLHFPAGCIAIWFTLSRRPAHACTSSIIQVNICQHRHVHSIHRNTGRAAVCLGFSARSGYKLEAILASVLLSGRACKVGPVAPRILPQLLGHTLYCDVCLASGEIYRGGGPSANGKGRVQTVVGRFIASHFCKEQKWECRSCCSLSLLSDWRQGKRNVCTCFVFFQYYFVF